MIVRYIAEFDTSFPDDVIDDGVDFHEGGRGVAAAVAEILQKLGCVVDGPIDAGDHGWGVAVESQGRSFWCEVTIIDRHLLQVINHRSWSDKFFRRVPVAYLATLKALGRELAADPRFWNIRWYSHEEYRKDGPGADQPVG